MEDAKDYTGHCARVSGATLLANAGASVLELKKAGGWNSNVAETYVAQSDEARMQVAKKMRFDYNLSNQVQNTSNSSTSNATSGSGNVFNTVNLSIDMKYTKDSTFVLNLNK